MKTAVDSFILPTYDWSQKTIAADNTGRFYLVWLQRPVNPPDYPSIYFQHSTDWGTTWSPPYLLEHGWGPEIATDSIGNVNLVWLGNGSIFDRRSTDGGQTWQPDTILVDASYYGHPAAEEKIIADEKGVVHSIWSQGLDGYISEVAYKRSSDGGATWRPDTFLTNTQLMHASVAIALDNQDRPHICWYEYPSLSAGQVWYQDAIDNGLTWNPPILIADNDSTLPGDPNVAVDGLDRVYVFYTAYWHWAPDSSDREIVYNVSEDTGRTFGPRRVLSLYPEHAEFPATVTGDVFGGIHAVWNDEGLYLRYNGSTDGGRTWRYSLSNPLAISDSLWEQWPSITSDSKGKVHLVAEGIGSTNTIYYGVYCSGYPLGVEENRQGDKETRGQGERLRATPNPFTSFARIPGHEGERFDIYDITGRRVGTYKGDRIGEGLAAGVYFLRAEDNASKPLRIVKLR